jgi:hypothetical protein
MMNYRTNVCPGIYGICLPENIHYRIIAHHSLIAPKKPPQYFHLHQFIAKKIDLSVYPYIYANVKIYA